jgi:hypothetical protein
VSCHLLGTLTAAPVKNRLVLKLSVAKGIDYPPGLNAPKKNHLALELSVEEEINCSLRLRALEKIH